MGVFTPDIKNLRELYTTDLQKALNMEKQLVDKGLPTMIDAATDPDLKNAFRTHLEETRGHVARLDRILKGIKGDSEGNVSDKTCKVMSSLISEGGSAAKDADDKQLRDVVLIAAGNQVEHHEIAVYGTLRTWAELLGEDDQARWLEQTLEEEKNADELLTKLSQQINVEAPVA